jgi:hypothetical protein
MAGDSSIGLGSQRPLVSVGVTRSLLRARTVARGLDPASRKAGPGRGPSRVEALMTGPAVCVGIDVSKATLDLALRPTGERWTVANEAAAIQTLAQDLRPHAPDLIVLEATGGFEPAVVAALAAAGLPVVVANPRQVRDVARATGQRAKTDAIDAEGAGALRRARAPRAPPAARTRRPKRSTRCSPDGGNSSTCWSPRRIASASLARWSGAASPSTFAGSSGGSATSITRSAR